jgi:hypothetical protein
MKCPFSLGIERESYSIKLPLKSIPHHKAQQFTRTIPLHPLRKPQFPCLLRLLHLLHLLPLLLKIFYRPISLAALPILTTVALPLPSFPINTGNKHLNNSAGARQLMVYITSLPSFVFASFTRSCKQRNSLSRRLPTLGSPQHRSWI